MSEGPPVFSSVVEVLDNLPTFKDVFRSILRMKSKTKAVSTEEKTISK